MNKVIIQNIESFNKFLDNFNFKQFAFDTEVTELDVKKLKLVGMSFYDGGETSYYIPLGHKQGEQLEFQSTLERVFQAIRNKTEVLICHNIKFDMKVMQKYWDYKVLEEKQWWDTMIASSLLDENLPSHALKNLMTRFFGTDTTKFDSFLQRYPNASFVPISELGHYACNDVEFTWKLYQLFQPKLVEEELMEYFIKAEMPFTRVLIDIELRGVKIDTKLLDHYLEVVNKRIIEVEQLIQQSFPKQEKQQTLFGGVINNTNVDSSKQLQKVLFEDMGFPVLQKTESGQPSCDSEHFEELYKKTNHPIFKLLVENKKLKKLYTSFLESYKEKVVDGRIYFEMFQNGAKTGRLSCREPNIQQLPGLHQYKVYGEEIEIRKLFISDDNRIFLVKDYSSQELRLCAHIANEQSMISAFANGMDFHLLNAKKTFGLDIPDEALYEVHPSYKEFKDKYKLERTRAKMISFGLAYGKSARSFMSDFNVSEQEAQAFVNKFFNAFPNLKKSIDGAHKQVQRDGFVRNIFGRKRRFTPVENVGYSFRDMRQAYNAKVQGSGASLLKVVCGKLYKEFKAKGKEASIVFLIHDEIGIQIPEDKVEEYEPLMRNVLENTVKLRLPLVTNGSQGKCYADAK